MNLLVAEDYTVKVSDFGVSKATSGKTNNSKVGSLNWCPPETLLHKMPYTPKSDVYSFGMVLYEIATHRLPFGDLGPMQVILAIDTGKRPEIPPHIPDDFALLAEDCWKPEPDDRPDFEEIVQRLQACINGTSSSSSSADSISPEPSPRVSK